MPLDVDAMAAEVVLLVKSALAPVLERLAVAETRLAEVDKYAARVEGYTSFLQRDAAALSERVVAMDDLRDRLVTLETRAAGPSVTDMAVVDLRERVAALDLGGLRERIAVLETRPSLPGPPGDQGPAGKDGLDGKDGTAGLSFEGVYQDGKSYEPGQLATWAGSSWHCNEPTTSKPGDGSKAWTLMVKRGRDGKDGRDAVVVPVVSVGRRD